MKENPVMEMFKLWKERTGETNEGLCEFLAVNYPGTKNTFSPWVYGSEIPDHSHAMNLIRHLGFTVKDEVVQKIQQYYENKRKLPRRWKTIPACIAAQQSGRAA